MSSKMALHLAIIDVGTLKSKFEIREFTPDGRSKVVYRDKKLTVLGRDLTKTNNRIIATAVETTIAALQKFKEEMVRFRVQRYKAITTEAVRKAANAKEVLDQIHAETGIALEVMTHENEARIFFRQVAKSFPGKRIAVSDIGGGSVQLVTGRDDYIESIHLFKTGTYFMQEEFSESHHPSADELQNAQEYVKREFTSLASEQPEVDELIYGSTNIIDFMQAVRLEMLPSGYDDPHLYRTSRAELEKLYEQIIALSYEDRMPLFPAEPYYMWSADNALINIFAFLDILKVTTVIPTNENISSGLFHELFEEKTTYQLLYRAL